MHGQQEGRPVTLSLQKSFFDIVHGVDTTHRHWLTPV